MSDDILKEMEDRQNEWERLKQVAAEHAELMDGDLGKAVKALLNMANTMDGWLCRAVVFKHESHISLSSIECPECGERFWVNCGDISDITAYEPDAYRCPHCGKASLITDKIMTEINDLSPEEIEEHAEDGFKTPNEAIGLK